MMLFFALQGTQRRPRSMGPVHGTLAAYAFTPRQRTLRHNARRWWIVVCESAAQGRELIELSDKAAILDCGRNARGL
jgi:hypothetical protein